MTRACGDCQLCCSLLPVRSMAKLAGQRCSHQQHHKGCKVYPKLFSVAPECKLWNCRWLLNDDAGELRRPDRSHYVIDVMPEYITLGDEDGVQHRVRVVQVWVDPKHPDAHRDPALRAWLERRPGWAALVRYSAHEGFVIFPPNMSGDGQFHEMKSTHPPTETHTAADLVDAFGWDALGVAP